MKKHLWLCLAIFLVSAPAHAVDKNAVALKGFNERVKQYVDLHKKVERGLPQDKESADPAVLVSRKQQFARAMAAARPAAKQGDIFTPAVRPIFLRTVRAALTGPGSAKAREMVLGEGNPKGPESTKVPKVEVNVAYPSEAPLSTVPPSLLMALPLIPEELEYRFIGHDLILRDVKADLIVDYIRRAAP